MPAGTEYVLRRVGSERDEIRLERMSVCVVSSNDIKGETYRPLIAVEIL